MRRALPIWTRFASRPQASARSSCTRVRAISASLETISGAIARLARAGFCDSFRARSGRLLALGKRQARAPEDLLVREIVRFEGESDPGDAAVLFALRSRDGSARGILGAGDGANADAETTAVMGRLGANHAAVPG